jgi:phage-related protein
MRLDLPTTVQASLQDLDADGFAHLFKLHLSSGTIFRLSKRGQVKWQGHTYEDIPCNMAEIAQNADGKMNRPKFTVVNPEGLFHPFVYQKLVDGAAITRYRILSADLKANRNFAITESFRVSRVMSLTKDLMVLELRDVLDGHSFNIPARTFTPPEFPYVRLS